MLLHKTRRFSILGESCKRLLTYISVSTPCRSFRSWRFAIGFPPSIHMTPEMKLVHYHIHLPQPFGHSLLPPFFPYRHHQIILSAVPKFFHCWRCLLFSVWHSDTLSSRVSENIDMFLFSTLALSILGTFACDSLDIHPFVTWYDCTFVTPYILGESHYVTIFSLSPLANLDLILCDLGDGLHMISSQVLPFWSAHEVQEGNHIHYTH